MSSTNEGLPEKLYRGISLAESNPTDAVPLLQSLQQDVVALSLFSKNETMEDVSTKSIPFLALEHYLALALVSLPTGPGKMNERKSHILQGCDLWAAFLAKLESLELLTKEEAKEYQELLQETDITANIPAPNRDVKIARFKAKKAAQAEADRLKALRERRNRTGLEAEEEMDGHDEESLERTVALKELEIAKSEAIEQWSHSKRELPMIETMVKMEGERDSERQHQGTPVSEKTSQPLSGKPLQVTHITKDASGQLQMKKEEIRSKVFRPGWSQPTMSLAELGEREYRQAMKREERQKIAEDEQQNLPRRYEDLLRDGLEDNADIVDASAKLDRDWDDFKDENPRGSGNKHANRGDKNF